MEKWFINFFWLFTNFIPYDYQHLCNCLYQVAKMKINFKNCIFVLLKAGTLMIQYDTCSRICNCYNPNLKKIDSAVHYCWWLSLVCLLFTHKRLMQHELFYAMILFNIVGNPPVLANLFDNVVDKINNVLKLVLCSTTVLTSWSFTLTCTSWERTKRWSQKYSWG